MYKKIVKRLVLILLIGFGCKINNSFGQISSISKNDTTLVYQKNLIVGKIGQKTKFNCIDCYYLKEIEIRNVKITLKTPVSNRTINNELLLESDFALNEIINQKNYTTIKYSSTSTSKAYEINLINFKNKLFVTKILTNSYAMIDLKINKNDFDSFQSNNICQKNIKKIINDTIVLNDIQNFKNNECFNCPIKYSIEECLNNKSKKIKMYWK